jgi:transcriptional regulator with XRE-family HTH domain
MLLHDATISAIADNATAIYRGRAVFPKIQQDGGMENDAWRQRLEAAVEKDNRKLREISLAAGLSHGYLHGILRDGKEPTIDRFARICNELGLSLSYALMGVDITPETEQLINQIDGDDDSRHALIALMKARQKS